MYKTSTTARAAVYGNLISAGLRPPEINQIPDPIMDAMAARFEPEPKPVATQDGHATATFGGVTYEISLAAFHMTSVHGELPRIALDGVVVDESPAGVTYGCDAPAATADDRPSSARGWNAFWKAGATVGEQPATGHAGEDHDVPPQPRTPTAADCLLSAFDKLTAALADAADRLGDRR